MYLKSLTLKGFKSFASATTLKFEPGICAVVGPNGSGKSNVVDALAWVMGEHSAKTLRGGKMEDVIFAGTSGRKPLGRAEVTLTIDNSDGALPIEYREVSVTRRMFRDGASEYEINGSRVRLMDVQELLSDTGIGREMHIIVGQGRLAQILESRPEDRRAYIEEAAGVLKHRRRKEKAQRKLASMQTNIDRLQDLTGELSRQLKPLARQAEAAKRAQTVQADLRDAKLRLAAADFVDLQASFADVNAQAELIAEQVAIAEEKVEITAERSLDLEAELEEVQPAAEAAQQLWFNLSALNERISATARIAADRAADSAPTPWSGPDPDFLDERADVAAEEEAELEEIENTARERVEEIQELLLDAEATARETEAEHLAAVRAIADRREGVVRLLSAEESLRTRLTAAEEEVARLAEQSVEAGARRADATEAVEVASEELAEAELAGPELQSAFDRAEKEAAAAKVRLQELRTTEREAEREVAGLSARIDALEAAVAAAANDGAAWLRENYELASVSQSLTIDSGWEKAVTAALGSAAEALVSADAQEQLTALAEAQRGRATVMVPRIGDKSAGTKSQSWRLDVDLPAHAAWLLDRLHVSDELVVPLTALLVDVVAVGSIDEAQAIVAEDNRLRAVTAEGIIVGPNWISGGAGDAKSSMEITADIARTHEELDKAQQRLNDLAGVLAGATAEDEDRRTDVAANRANLREHQQLLKLLNDARTRATATLSGVIHDTDRADQRREAAEKRAKDLKEELDEVVDRLARVEQDPDEGEPSTDARDRAAEAVAAHRAMFTEAQLALRTAEERAKSIRGKAERFRRQAAAERIARQRHEQAQAKRAHERQVAATVAELAENLSHEVSVSLARAEADRDALDTRKRTISAALQTARQEENAARQELGNLTQSAHQGDIAKAQAQVRINEAADRIVEQLGLSVDDLLNDYTPDEEFDRVATTKKLKQAEKDLRVLGRVNPLALEEYKAMEERYSFLSTQLDDVLSARKDLLGVVDEVDETILRLFEDAWRDVEAEFPKVFHTLFPGGEGRLVLTEPDDLLTTGIEVEARPPGKKVKRLSLLSGGEKSLTTLAMLVAIFRARPSPFYVLDEVEAALDDVNLRRLIALLKELRETSQLIVITHQKPTMDVANVLYGVTMRGDGVTRVLSQRMSPVD